jgi:hypothetical protein
VSVVQDFEFVNDLTGTRLVKYRYWIEAWSEGLAYCLNCDEEYRTHEAVFVDEVENCPHCMTDYGKRYYYCKEHGSPDDDCER